MLPPRCNRTVCNVHFVGLRIGSGKQSARARFACQSGTLKGRRRRVAQGRLRRVRSIDASLAPDPCKQLIGCILAGGVLICSHRVAYECIYRPNRKTDTAQGATLARLARARERREFGRWFGVALDGRAFTVGQRVRGHVTYPGYEHVIFEVVIERLEPDQCLSWRWHPAAIERDVDYSQEPTTLVVFELREADGGTLLSVVESGFDNIPPQRHLEAFRMNSNGWDEQMQSIRAHVATP